MSLALQAGLIKGLMSIEDIANLVEIETPKKRGTYKKTKLKNESKIIF